ncbi:hypothetical protein OYC64_003959 [Pagothenia borchgrevinki]|uniref:Uncharacterized protein n=1 Tax=Pagothenia borchgrevinki TaxID=8213 RepID=A0ABD2FTG2_PAGBO
MEKNLPEPQLQRPSGVLKKNSLLQDHLGGGLPSNHWIYFRFLYLTALLGVSTLRLSNLHFEEEVLEGLQSEASKHGSFYFFISVF